MDSYKFTFDAFDRDRQYQYCIGRVKVTVVANDEEEARKKAKAIVDREFFDLERIDSGELI